MQTADFWHKLHLHRAKIVLVLALFVSHWSLAQKAPVTMYRVESDQKPLKYGFFLGYHSNTFGIQYSDAFSSPAFDNVSSIVSQRSAGFNLGFMVNFRLSDQFTVRTVPVKIALYQHTVDYNFTDGTTDSQLIESTRIEPGIFLKYRSIRRENTRMYIIGGLSGSWRSGKPEEGNTDRLEVRRLDIRAEVGFGLEKYFKFFKWSPEIRYSRGLINVISPNNTLFSNGINRLVTHNFTFYLHFSD